MDRTADPAATEARRSRPGLTQAEALAEIRELLLSPGLIRASARKRGSIAGVTIRPVELKAGRRLQVVTTGGPRPVTTNVIDVDPLLAEPFGNWVVETTTGTVRMQATKKGAVMHRSATAASTLDSAHDRAKEHLLDPGDPLFDVIGGNAAKRRQVDAFLRQLPALEGPLHIVDLGCGNAYLTFAAYHYLSQRGIDVRLTGVDVREDQRDRNNRLAQELGWSSQVRFVAGSIATVEVDRPDMVLALHACDTATDDALARAVQWQAKWVLAAPCCHRDISRQLRLKSTDRQSHLLTSHGILRERFADVLTDVVRAGLLREYGYDVEVVEFIDSAHTPRNALIKAVRTGHPRHDPALEALLAEWEIKPAMLAAVSARSVSGSSD